MRRDRLVLLASTTALFSFLYLTLELPKRIVNDTIGAQSSRVEVLDRRRPGGFSGPHLHRFLGISACARPAQDAHLYDDRCFVRKDAAAAALRADFGDDAVPETLLPAHFAGRVGGDDHQRD